MAKWYGYNLRIIVALFGIAIIMELLAEDRQI